MQKEQATTKYKAWLNLTYIILSEDSQTQREHAVWFPLFIQSSETGKNTYGDRSRNSGYLCQELMTGRECEKGFWVLIMLIWGMVIWGIFICENSLNYIFKICYFIIYHALFYQKCFSTHCYTHCLYLCTLLLVL